MIISEITLSRLYFYPIKSAGSIAVDSATVDPRGLRHDRGWMLVDEADRFMTQRRYPRMALVSVGFSSECLVVDAPGMRTLYG